MSSRKARRIDASRLAQPRIKVSSLLPRYGENYKAGYIGFVHEGGSPSQGVAHFSRWSRLSDLHVSHAVIVTGENECVEALTGKGVVCSSLDKYFKNARTQIFFRKPRKCSSSVGSRIAETALAQVGTKFENLLLAAQVLEGSFLRRWIHSAFHDSPQHFAGKLQDRDPQWLSAELAAYCLDCQPEYAGKGVLARPHYLVSLQEFFEDTEIFAGWNQDEKEDEKPEEFPVVPPV